MMLNVCTFKRLDAWIEPHHPQALSQSPNFNATLKAGRSREDMGRSHQLRLRAIIKLMRGYRTVQRVDYSRHYRPRVRRDKFK